MEFVKTKKILYVNSVLEKERDRERERERNQESERESERPGVA